MGAGYHGGFGKTNGAKRRLAIANISFMPQKEEFGQYIAKRKDIDADGFFDVIAHGDSHNIEIETGGKVYKIQHRTAAKILSKNTAYKKGQPIRLLSCNTGKVDDGFAQNLANKLNVPVKAPTKYAFAYEDGKHFVAGSKDGKNPDYTDRGTYRTFYPKRRKK